VLESLCAERDWRGALSAVERRASIGLLDKPAAKRQRAVLLAADALDRVERDRHGALTSALDAAKLAPDLIPSAALAGRLLSDRGDLRRAAKIVESAWRHQPHPDLAEVYINLRPGDSALDRLKRAETLVRLASGDPEGRLAVARTALEAREFARARAALEPLVAERPTMRVCLLMSDLEQAEHGATGKGREWLARAARAPRDPAWIADGVVSDQWAPISPVTGRIDAFVWQAPPDVLVAPEVAFSDDVAADLDDQPKVLPILVAEEDAVGEAGVTAATATAPPEDVRPEIERATESVSAQPDQAGSAPRGGRTEPVAFPLEPAPDDSGPPAAGGRRQLFW
jgi:HemY protein